MNAADLFNVLKSRPDNINEIIERRTIGQVTAYSADKIKSTYQINAKNAKPLGKGGFGEVLLVKVNGKKKALKVFQKKEVEHYETILEDTICRELVTQSGELSKRHPIEFRKGIAKAIQEEKSKGRKRFFF